MALRHTTFLAFLTYQLAFSLSASIKESIRSDTILDEELFEKVGDKLLTLGEEELAGKEVFVIGDVHGCYSQLIDLLTKMEVLQNPSDPKAGLVGDAVVILAGDLVNKGPSSEKVMKFARQTKDVYAIRGNHELKYIQKHPNSSWRPWIENLPYLIHIPKYNSFVAHAGMLPNRGAEEQDKWTVTHMRNVEIGADGELKPLERTYEGEHWAPVWSAGSKSMVYFGHDAGRTYVVQRFPSATGIDTRCVKGGELTAVQLPVSDEIFYTQKCSKKCL